MNEYLPFSCVIVTYNRKNSLTSLLNDISNQQILPLEVIVVNNGDDITLDNFNFPLKIINNSRNSLTSGRNLGFKNVTGKYVFFLDDDIRINKKYFKSMLVDFLTLKDCFGLQAHIKQDYSPSIRSVIFNFFSLYTLGNDCIVKASVNVTYPIKHTENDIIPCEWISGTNQLYETSRLKDFKWDEQMTKYCDGEDLDFSYNLFLNDKKLFLTFNQSIIHEEATTSRLDSKEIVYMREVYGLYIFYKYFDKIEHKTTFLWSRFGKLFISVINIFRGFKLHAFLEFKNLINALIFVFLNKRKIKSGNLDKFNKKFNYKF